MKYEIEMWKVPPDWRGQRCFILGGGPSIKDYREQIKTLPNPLIAINESIALRPDADVAFWADYGWFQANTKLVASHTGKWKVCRRQPSKAQDFPIKWVGQKQSDSKGNSGLSKNPREVGGKDSGGSAINLAYLLGATEIVLLGFDMQPGHWHDHYPREAKQTHYDQFRRHIETMRQPLIDAGVKVYTVGPSKLSFPNRKLEEFL